MQQQNANRTSNLWIGELDNWMEEKYLVQSLEEFGKLYFKLYIFYRY